LKKIKKKMKKIFLWTLPSDIEVKKLQSFIWQFCSNCVLASVAEPHHFSAAPGENFAPAPTLLYSNAKFLKRTKVDTHVETMLFIWFCTIFIAENMNWMGYNL
jgi:hypothetical protein